MVVYYSGASFANLRNISSQRGYLVFLYEEKNSFTLISWKSKKIQRVAERTLAAKKLALVESLEPCYMVRAIL